MGPPAQCASMGAPMACLSATPVAPWLRLALAGGGSDQTTASRLTRARVPAAAPSCQGWQTQSYSCHMCLSGMPPTHGLSLKYAPFEELLAQVVITPNST